VITALYKKGLVEKIISAPTKYKAVPIEETLDTLMQNKAAEINAAFSRKNELLKKFGNKQINGHHEEPQFMLVVGKGNILKNALEKHENARESIDFAGPWEAFLTYFFSQKESVEITGRNNAKIRMIINKPENPQTISKIEKFLKEFPNIHLKYASDSPFLISIHDKKFVLTPF
jgi:sugar-specific transcriptional regulator TrmB